MVKKKKEEVTNHFFSKSVFSLVIISILVISISAFFIESEKYIGLSFLVLAVVAILFLKSYGLNVKNVTPDIIFGVIDNGVLVFAAIIGGAYAGVFGAVIGGAAGNTITDGIGGLFEGHFAEKLRKRNINDQRNSLSTMLGKVIGCLIGAGAGLTLVWFIKIF